MSLPKIITALAFFAAIGVYGCTSSDNEPQNPPVIPDTPKENPSVGLSKKNAMLLSWGDNVYIDTIEVAADDWVITTVSFCDAKYFDAPYLYPKTEYVTDLSGRESFDETVSWLRMEYSDGRLILSDVNPAYVPEWPEYRYAFVEFERGGEITDTIICKDESEVPLGFHGIGPDPGTVVFPKQGGSVNLMTNSIGWVFHWLMVDGVRHEFSEDDGTQDFMESWTNTDFEYTMDWVTIERYKFGNPAEITVTVAPNNTGREREFSCGIGPWAVWGVFYGTQEAD
ncbi:MAG: hypothetical protein K2L32_08780 [Muribaculaceae bacterium]|nr:hypothetical protein [Muribaculaceae bacterium]